MNYFSRAGVVYSSKNKENIIEKVCLHFDLEISQVYLKSRLRDIIEARSIIMYLLHKHLRMSCTDVGRVFNKDHATVLHACKKVSGFMDVDKSYRVLVNKFK